MTITEANAILGMTPDRLREHVSKLRRHKQLSSMVRALNADLLGGDAEAKVRARAVLDRIGLLQVA